MYWCLGSLKSSINGLRYIPKKIRKIDCSLLREAEKKQKQQRNKQFIRINNNKKTLSLSLCATEKREHNKIVVAHLIKYDEQKGVLQKWTLGQKFEGSFKFTILVMGGRTLLAEATVES